MSYWSHNPKLYDEIIFKRMVTEGVAKEEDLEEKEIWMIVDEYLANHKSFELAMRAESKHWGDRIDEDHSLNRVA